MSVRADNVIEYFERFGAPVPCYYMDHLSDEDFKSMVVKAIHDNIPIDPESLVKNLPEDAYL